MLCVTRYSSGLCDMHCYSMNGSHTSQGGIPMRGMSQIKTEHFSLPWRLHLPPRPSCICTPSCQNVILCLAPSLSPPRGWVTGMRGLCLLPPPTRESRAAVNMKELYLHLTGGSSVSELIRSRPKNSSNVDEPAMRLGAETWRNTVGGGTVSGLWAMLWKGSLEVLLLSRFSCVQLCATL